MTINGQNITKGFNVNDKTHPFTEQILSGLKDIETRDTASLGSLIGKRVAIIRTGCGEAKIVGLADIIDVKTYCNEREFADDNYRHQVPWGSKYWIKKGKIKLGYMLDNVEICDPISVTSKGIVIRNI